MIILGDISGIQGYVFDVAEEGGGQAQRLRARSFFVQLLAEVAAQRVLRALDWKFVSVRLSGAGKFLLEGPDSPIAVELLTEEQQLINEWLLRETRGELRMTLSGPSFCYVEAQRQLQHLKSLAWAPMADADWDTSRLILAPLGTPCSLCGHGSAQEVETDRDTGEVRRVCRTCASFRRLGQRLPRARWLVVRDIPESADIEMLGLGIAVIDSVQPAIDSHVIAVANLRNPSECPSWCPPERFIRRRLMAHVPTDQDGCPVWFTELVHQAQGDRLLAVLKADVDSLGVRFQYLLDNGGLEGMACLSEQLDAFFAGRLRDELANSQRGKWQSIYTIFAGGDDLVMVGPWDVMIRFAGQIRDWFTQEFRSHALTLSAGLALIKPKRPIKFAVAEAERLLELAKDGGKDRLAAFRQIWKWEDHEQIVKAAGQLVEWVDSGEMERGWLHTLLELTEARYGSTPDPLATAQLAYHVNRNYRKNSVRHWAERLVERFDNSEDIEVHYLPAIVRYALTATRQPDLEQ